MHGRCGEASGVRGVDSYYVGAVLASTKRRWRSWWSPWVLSFGRQFPDKAIDLIDEACSTVRLQIDSQRWVNTTRMQTNNENTSVNGVKEAIVGPDHVAQCFLWTSKAIMAIKMVDN
ncbi:hypothetical protein E2562_038311 [Oryza meyeriana var. granulata]|uniref:ClpA/ClpB AAA lid domain-containing protein n=1 Tax=Oryza meyeriana var. granulata TaxID=110450 RepID=A0A6G1ECP8_9ORYZ|nr:hypothetical protein E2562_038311 [Oryza meyeriana var. granulata]